MNTHLLVFKHLQSPAVSFLRLLLILVVSNVASIVSNTLITSIASIVPVLSLLARLLLLSTFALLFAQRLETYLAFEDLFKVFFRQKPATLLSRYHLLHHQDDQYLNHLPVQLLIKNRGTKHLTPPTARQS